MKNFFCAAVILCAGMLSGCSQGTETGSSSEAAATESKAVTVKTGTGNNFVLSAVLDHEDNDGTSFTKHYTATLQYNDTTFFFRTETELARTFARVVVTQSGNTSTPGPTTVGTTTRDVQLVQTGSSQGHFSGTFALTVSGFLAFKPVPQLASANLQFSSEAGEFAKGDPSIRDSDFERGYNVDIRKLN